MTRKDGINEMKKKLLLVVIAAGVNGMVHADYLTETVDGISWAYRIEGDVAVIASRSSYDKVSSASWSGSGWEWVWTYRPSIDSNTVGAVAIPSSLGGKPVTSIDSWVFYNCSTITSLSLPSSITNISGHVCFPRVDELHVPNLAMLYSGIHFQELSSNPITAAPDADLYVDGKLTTEVIIPDGVTTIGDYAFSGWRGLTKVEFPSSVTNIGSYAFYGCLGLERIEFPENLNTIGSYAFYGCGLMDVSIPPNMPIIGEKAFCECENLRNMKLTAFRFKYDNDNHLYDWEYRLNSIVNVSNVTNLVFESGLKTIPGGVSVFTNLTSITIPESVTNIAANAFDNCSRLQAEWTKTLAKLSAQGVGSEARYDLAGYVADRTIASVTVDGDAAIDEFVLTDGKVYDCAIRIVNVASTAVYVTLPEGHTYESFVGAAPLTIPPNSTNMLTITRTGTGTFLVARRQLQVIGR